MHILDIIDKATLTELCQPSNEVATRHLIYRLVGEAALFFATLLLFDEWLLFSLALFYACAVWHGFWGYAGIGHELYHNRVFSNPVINKLLYRLASYLTWNNPEFFRVSHSYHHRNTFAADDVEAFSTQDWSPLAVAFYLTIDIPLLSRRLFYAFINSAGLSLRENKLCRIGRAYQLESILMITFHGLAHAGLWAVFHAWHVNLMWFLLPFTGQFFNRLLAQSQHIGLADFKADGPLKHSRTLSLPGLIEFLYAGMNFHAEHHLVPAIPYYKLSKLHSLLLERKLLDRLDTVAFFRTDIWQALRQPR